MGILDTIKQIFAGAKPTAEPEDTAHGPRQPEAEELSPEMYKTALEAERAEKNNFFRSSPYSPLEPEDRQRFTGLAYYPPDLAFRYELPLQAAETPEELTFQTSTGGEQSYHRLGTVHFEVAGQPAHLAIYRSTQHDELFLPFRDATSGQETYGAGRYLEPVELPGGAILVDFNLAYNPYCAYSPHYSCPLPPVENWLKIAIRAGEKAYKK